MKERPTLLLDVDGVLNVCNMRTWKQREVRHEGRALHPEAYTAAFMRLAWAYSDVWWCSCWMNGCNVWARWAGLTERPMVMDLIRRTRRAHTWRGDWKLHCAKRLFARDTWRRIIWIEDGFSDEARRWARHHRNWKLINIDPERGVGVNHAQALGWDDMGIAWPEKAQA